MITYLRLFLCIFVINKIFLPYNCIVVTDCLTLLYEIITDC